VSYLTLVDIPDVAKAIAEMARVLRPGGSLLIANLTSFNTAGGPDGWTRDAGGNCRFFIDNYLEERAEWVSWRGIRIHNWHRPLGTYMSLLLGERLELRHFAEPTPVGGDPRKAEHYRRVPYFLVMEWQKPQG
jgi:SAM-dependent methyltransferase